MASAPCYGVGVRLTRQTLEQRAVIATEAMTRMIVAPRALLAPRVPPTIARTNDRASPGREASAEKRGCRYRGPDGQALPPVVRSSRHTLFGKRARLSALSAAFADCSAQSGPTLHGSANGFSTPSATRQPAPGRPASWPAGRVSEPPARRSVSPRPQEPPSLPFGEYPRPRLSHIR